MLGLLIVLVATFLTATGRAATFAVDTTADGVDLLVGDTLCATDLGRCTLRAAIQESNAVPGVDEIILPAGTYVLGLPAAAEGLSLDSDLDITDALSLDGENVANTIIQGSSPTGAILHVDAAVPVSVVDVTIQDGVSGIVQEGCCELMTLARVRVTRVEVGVFAESGLSTSEVVVEDVGDGIFGTSLQLATTRVQRCTRSGVTSFHGAMDIRDSTVADCLGPGVDNLGGSSSIVRSTIVRNGGGGVRNYVDALITLIDTTVSGNTASQGGGVRAGSLDAGALLINTTVSDNRAAEGGGIWATGSCVNVALINSTVSGNRATGHGGGIYDAHSNCGSSLLDNATIADNVADSDGDGAGDGGGIAALGEPMVLENTVLADNLDAGAEAPDCTGALDSARYSLVEALAGCVVEGDATGMVVGMDAGLEPLADKGGRTQTHALRAGSRAIDAGDPTGCRDFTEDPITTDQRGAIRPQGAACDAGAYEFGCELSSNDLDGDGLGDACDPDDAPLQLQQVRVHPDGRRARETGTIEVAGEFATTPPVDVIGDGGLTILVHDDRRSLQAQAWEAAECRHATRGALACRSEDGRFACTLRPVRADPGRYRLRARLRGLSLTGPFTSPLSITLIHPSGVDRVGTASTCEVSKAGTLKCGLSARAERRKPPRRRSAS